MRIVIDARIRRASTGRPIAHLLEGLQKLDHDNQYIILLQPDDDWKPENDNFSVKPCKYPIFSFNPLQQITFSWMLYRLRANLVYFTLTPQQPLLYFKKQITLTHDLTMLRYVRAGRLPEWLHKLRMVGYRLLFWNAHRKAKAIIVPSEYVAKDLAQLHKFAKHKIKVIYESSELPLKGKSEPVPSVKKPFIFHVGSPFPHKNIPKLIAAFEILHKKNPKLSLILGGKKEYYFDQLEDHVIAHSTAGESIIVTGFVSNEQLKWLYENAEAYVLPSLSEGFGLPGLEAMAYDCPLVSSNATCLPEIYGNAAVYFDPKNVEDMAEKVSKVIGSSSTQKAIIKKGEAQLKKYSWDKMTKEMFEAIKKA